MLDSASYTLENKKHILAIFKPTYWKYLLGVMTMLIIMAWLCHNHIRSGFWDHFSLRRFNVVMFCCAFRSSLPSEKREENEKNNDFFSPTMLRIAIWSLHVYICYTRLASHWNVSQPTRYNTVEKIKWIPLYGRAHKLLRSKEWF